MKFIKRFLLCLFGLALACSVFFIFHASILRAYAAFFTVDNPTKGADAIVMLGGDPEGRVKKSVWLYKNGYAPQILLTTVKEYKTDYPDIFKCQQDVMAQIFGKEKLKYERMPSLKDGARSTFDEAYDAAEFAKKRGFKHIIIVTGEASTKRALFAFKKVFRLTETNVTVEASPAEYEVYGKNDWWLTDGGLSVYLLEPMKFMMYYMTSQNLSFVQKPR